MGDVTPSCVDTLLAVGGVSQALAEAVCAQTQAATADIQSALDNTIYGVNTGWLILAGALVFVMHGGFAMLCAGAIRSKNTLNILLMTILDACVSAIMFYLVGYGFAYGVGSKPNRFIGNALFAMNNWLTSPTGTGNGRWSDWFFQWAFAATATTIPAGAVAERFNFNAYLCYCVLISGFVYPVVVHWVWSAEGWLSYALTSGNESPFRTSWLFGSGMIDFAGSAVVHMTGGLTGLMGCWLVGPRLGRFDSNGNPVDMPGHSATLVVLGTVLLWFGWYGFNPGSVLILTLESNARVAARAAVCSTLSAAAGGLACMVNAFRRQKAWDLVCLCNGVLVGLVSVTACCHVIEPWAAILVGSLGGLIFDGVCWLFLKLRIDDPLSAAPMHAFGGAWGIFFTGLLAKEEYVNEVYGRASHFGAFYGKSGNLLAAQIIGIIAIAAWVCGLSGMLFFGLKMAGMLRISEEDEHRGLDVSKHGGSAYNTHGHESHTPQLTK